MPQPIACACKARQLLLAFGLGAAALGASAASFDFLHGGSLGPWETDSFFNVAYDGASASGTLEVGLLGYLSLDGTNYYRDQFVLLLNGAPIFAGSFNMGGGGNDSIDFNPMGALVHARANGTPDAYGASWQGGSASLLFEGLGLRRGDVLTLGYSSLGAPLYFGHQGLDDEAWGVARLQFTSALPEPSGAALLLAGAGVAALFARRRGTTCRP